MKFLTIAALGAIPLISIGFMLESLIGAGFAIMAPLLVVGIFFWGLGITPILKSRAFRKRTKAKETMRYVTERQEGDEE